MNKIKYQSSLIGGWYFYKNKRATVMSPKTKIMQAYPLNFPAIIANS